MNAQNDVSASAVAGGKLKLSEVVRALRAGEVELDCRDFILVAGDSGIASAFDVDSVNAKSRIDVALLQLFVGVQALVSEYLSYEPEAHAAVAAAYARGRRMVLLKQVSEDEAEDGKGVCHE